MILGEQLVPLCCCQHKMVIFTKWDPSIMRIPTTLLFFCLKVTITSTASLMSAQYGAVPATF